MNSNMIEQCKIEKCSNSILKEEKLCEFHSSFINPVHIKGKCNRICWKNTVRRHVCNKDFYKNETCYYHYIKANPNQLKYWKGFSSKNSKK
jgi:hypothetical protein